MKPHLILLVLLSAFLTSCSIFTSNEEDSTVDYVRGELRVEKGHSLQKVFTAVVKSFETSQFSIKSKKQDNFSAVVTATDAQSRNITAIAEKLGEKRTLLKIKVGLLGDASFSRQILAEIEKQLD